MNNTKKHKIVCVVPVYNDWQSFAVLAEHIFLLQQQYQDSYLFKIIAINDGSNEVFNQEHIKTIEVSYEIVDLKVNVGHQRAIAVGLQYVYHEEEYDFVVVMDSDGEDIPEQIPLLVQKALKENNSKIVFAQRNKRQESLFFKTGYFFYKHIFRFLTGQKINFGNYSCIPKVLMEKIVHQNNIWNHYSGGIIQSKIPFEKILLDRGKRYAGVSKMNFTGLVLHGLSSIAVYFDYLSVRILKISLYGIVICLISVFYILYQKLFTDNAIPGWASSLILILSGIVVQLFSMTLIVSLLQLSSRKNIIAPNSKIYKDFIK
ncbi:MAG: glycosyltransferase [Flavobacteriaceae bacterium]|jgi:glycosyltransferase involved in cell wall biosynthesis|nr:glycosyltransferase [Flavobacteriaceae bacterium]